MRMFTEIDRKVELHCTGVGKALLSQLSLEQVHGVVARVGIPAHTPQTITTEAELIDCVAHARRVGYVLDDQKQEIGVRCVAVPVSLGPVS